MVVRGERAIFFLYIGVVRGKINFQILVYKKAPIRQQYERARWVVVIEERILPIFNFLFLVQDS
nr:MAG TPA: hypothetical protein [Bacteriophage sp.]